VIFFSFFLLMKSMYYFIEWRVWRVWRGWRVYAGIFILNLKKKWGPYPPLPSITLHSLHSPPHSPYPPCASIFIPSEPAARPPAASPIPSPQGYPTSSAHNGEPKLLSTRLADRMTSRCQCSLGTGSRPAPARREKRCGGSKLKAYE